MLQILLSNHFRIEGTTALLTTIEKNNHRREAFSVAEIGAFDAFDRR